MEPWGLFIPSLRALQANHSIHTIVDEMGNKYIQKVGFISLSLEESTVAKPEELTVWGDGGLASDTWVSPQHEDLKMCFVTYIVDPEVSAGPVIPLFLRDHLHGDVSVSYGFFRERPVMVTFHLRGQWHNLLKQTGYGRKSLCSLRENRSPCLWRTVSYYREEEKWSKWKFLVHSKHSSHDHGW